MDNKNIPEYLLPYTKNSYEQWCKERELAIVKRASEVGKLKCCEETGWSNTIVNDACNRHGVEVRPRGRPKKTKSSSTSNHYRHINDVSCENDSAAHKTSKIVENHHQSDKSHEPVSVEAEKSTENARKSDHVKTPEILRDWNPSTKDEFIVNGFDYSDTSYYQPRDRVWKNKVKLRPLQEGCSVWQPEELPDNSGKILLTRGLFAIVDLDMVSLLNRFSWSATPDGGNVYATSCDRDKRNMRMHRYVLGLPHGQKAIVDHINGCGLDNRRCNLRIVSDSQNQLNRHKTVTVSSRFNGVVQGSVKGWTTYFKVDGKQTKKNFDTEEEAARYYDELVRKHRGPDAQTNESLGLFENFKDSE